jgi:transposase
MIGGILMNAVGIDISKGRSMIAVMRPLGEIVAKPFVVHHTASELSDLANYLKSLNGETRVVLEYTGKYYQPIARYLHDAGIFVSVVHAKLIHDYGNNSIRRIKTDKADAVKIANYGLTNWVSLQRYSPEDDTRLLLKTCNRQCSQYMKLKISLKNNIIALLDQTFPSINTLFTSPPRPDGHEKWVDFASKFWHCECVNKLSQPNFTALYNKWCAKSGYYGSDSKAAEVYELACCQVPTLPCSEAAKQLVEQAVSQINTISETLASLRQEMQRLAALLPEYPIVMAMYGVGNVLGPQLMAEIGDVRRFPRKQSLIAFAGVDAPPFQSGNYEAADRSISKRGSPSLRRTLFLVMGCLLQTAPSDDAVFQFLDRKRAEGKRFYVYMVAGCNKFLRIYYARVKEFLNGLDTAA